MVIQRSYSINPPVGFPGTIAEPNSPTRVEVGTLTVPTGATRANPRPGDALYYLQSADAWQVPVNAADQLMISGILTYPADTVANAASIVQFSDGDPIEVITMGVVWVIAGGASERGDILVMQTDDWKYDETARVTTVANMYEVPTQNFNRSAAVDNAIIKAAIGYGRAI
jgi:hypothetical protein